MPLPRLPFNVFTLLMIVSASFAKAEETASPIPEALHGVWRVESLEADGEVWEMAEDDVEGFREVIIQRGRFVTVTDDDEETLVYHASLMRNALGEQIRIWDKRGDRHRAWIIYRIDGDKLILSLASGDEGHPPMDFSAEKDSNQVVLTLTKAREPDPSTIKPERIVGFNGP